MASTSDAASREFDPTYAGSRHERAWLEESLGDFFDDHLFDDVLYPVKGGKEATVYCLKAGPTLGVPFLAAKVFRPRMFRAMRNDSLYKIGRDYRSAQGKVADSRTARAMRKRTAYGRQVDSASWCRFEYDVLETLSAAGVGVPRPVACSGNAILMEFVGDERGAAPVLASLRFEAAEAKLLLDRLFRDVETMLEQGVVHSDLSAHNVLWHGGEARIIDFPQAVDALVHPEAYALFSRDVHHLAGWFVRQGVAVDAGALAGEIWRRAVG